MNISLRLSDAEIELVKAYAKIKKRTVSEVIRTAILEQIEDEYDIEVYNNAMEEFKRNPVTYSLDEIERELGLK